MISNKEKKLDETKVRRLLKVLSFSEEKIAEYIQILKEKDCVKNEIDELHDKITSYIDLIYDLKLNEPLSCDKRDMLIKEIRKIFHGFIIFLNLQK